ncbi:MAG TPA: GerMN domain-containing protein [Acidimicrobiales bacterium]|nr:GerMN domain-containing protein [Acidimicrobiales bacterium]
MKQVARGAPRGPRQTRSRSQLSRSTRAALLLALALALGACGVPIDTIAHPLTDLPAYVPQAMPNSPGGTSTKLTLYFVQRDNLVVVHRSGFAYSLVEATANELLLDLDNGPLASEGRGVITLLNSQPGLTSTYTATTHILTINLDIQFINNLFGTSLYLAYGQIVLTLMHNAALTTVKGIQFALSGQLTYAYLPTETATRAPVTAANYASLIAHS